MAIVGSAHYRRPTSHILASNAEAKSIQIVGLTAQQMRAVIMSSAQRINRVTDIIFHNYRVTMMLPI